MQLLNVRQSPCNEDVRYFYIDPQYFLLNMHWGLPIVLTLFQYLGKSQKGIIVY